MKILTPSLLGGNMRILDLFCGAGGASMGYHRAWPDTEIVGVDIEDQPDYPFEFIQGDALDLYPWFLDGFDFIHASPPCQAYSRATPSEHDHPDLVLPTREMLQGHKYIIENVVGSPLHAHLMLCGSMFGLKVQRHRYFELWDGAPLIMAQACNHHEWENGRPFTVTGNTQQLEYKHSKKHRSLEHAKALMDMPWCTALRGVTEAIPPAYTEYIGKQLST